MNESDVFEKWWKDNYNRLALGFMNKLSVREGFLGALNLNTKEPADSAAVALLKELKEYGHIIAGGGPITGYGKAAATAERRWYAVTLPLINKIESQPPYPSGSGNTSKGGADKKETSPQIKQCNPCAECKALTQCIDELGENFSHPACYIP